MFLLLSISFHLVYLTTSAITIIHLPVRSQLKIMTLIYNNLKEGRTKLRQVAMLHNFIILCTVCDSGASKLFDSQLIVHHNISKRIFGCLQQGTSTRFTSPTRNQSIYFPFATRSFLGPFQSSDSFNSVAPNCSQNFVNFSPFFDVPSSVLKHTFFFFLPCCCWCDSKASIKYFPRTFANPSTGIQAVFDL